MAKNTGYKKTITKSVEPEVPKMKRYKDMSLKEMQAAGLELDIQQDFHPEAFE